MGQEGTIIGGNQIKANHDGEIYSVDDPRIYTRMAVEKTEAKARPTKRKAEEQLKMRECYVDVEPMLVDVADESSKPQDHGDRIGCAESPDSPNGSLAYKKLLVKRFRVEEPTDY